MKKTYRWNKRVFFNNLLELATLMVLTAICVWVTYEWIMGD